MKKLIFLTLLLIQNIFVFAQDNSFSFIGNYQDDITLFKLADSLKKPLLKSKNKIYVIGGDCITRDFGGKAIGRDDDGDENDRYRDGNSNNREKGGGIGYRDKKGKTNQRDKEGNILDRDKSGGANQRDQDGGTSIGTRCGVTRSGKLLLYTRENMKANQTKIYYAGKYFTNKYYKIIKL